MSMESLFLMGRGNDDCGNRILIKIFAHRCAFLQKGFTLLFKIAASSKMVLRMRDQKFSAVIGC